MTSGQGLFMLATLGVLGITGCSEPTADRASSERDGFPAEPPAEMELPTSLQISPEVVESNRITLVTARSSGQQAGGRVPGEVVSAPDGEAQVGVLVSGRVATIEANVGDEMKKGATLAWVEAVEVGAARAELQKTTALLNMQKARSQRQRTLEAEGATSTAAIEAARADLTGAEAERRSVILRLNAMGATSGSGSRFPLQAPIDGVIVERNVVLGAAVRPEQTLFSMVAPGRVLVVARFHASEASIPKKGAKMRLSPRGAEQSGCWGTVETQAQIVDPHTRTILVRLRPDNDCMGLRPGAYVEVQTGAEPDTAPASPRGGPAEPHPSPVISTLVEIPAASVIFVRGKETVFVAGDQPGHFSARRVVVRSINEEHALVAEGLAAGDRVVERGAILLKGEMLRDLMGGE